MKFLALASMILLSFSAQAMSPQYGKTEVLHKVQVNGQESRLTGLLKLDLFKKTIRVELYNDPCGQFTPPQPGTFKCMAAATLESTMEVPLQTQTTACGSLIYSGVKDMTTVDGPRTEINVVDHSKRLCRDLVPARVIVEASSYNPWKNETTKYLMMSDVY